MRFVDEATIKVKGGDGGAGIIAWRREKFVPLGGPAGGNGGNGGNIVVVAKEGVSSLLDLKRQTLISAADGQKGQIKNKAGKNGKDKIIYVPVGTIIETQSKRYDLKIPNQKIIVAAGGQGGFGNSHFKSAFDSAPMKATEGKKGELKELHLTLKLMADVGLLGFPNAGKSTLLKALSNARPKICDYPFTTLKPSLGVCTINFNPIVIADVPGLIEGASKGHGLGTRFLRHLERVRVLCHVIDVTGHKNLKQKFEAINVELKSYGEKLSFIPQIVAINKCDVITANQEKDISQFEQNLLSLGVQYCRISAVTGSGLDRLKNILYEKVSNIGRPNSVQVKSYNPLENLY